MLKINDIITNQSTADLDSRDGFLINGIHNAKFIQPHLCLLLIIQVQNIKMLRSKNNFFSPSQTPQKFVKSRPEARQRSQEDITTSANLQATFSVERYNKSQLLPQKRITTSFLYYRKNNTQSKHNVNKNSKRYSQKKDGSVRKFSGSWTRSKQRHHQTIQSCQNYNGDQENIWDNKLYRVEDKQFIQKISEIEEQYLQKYANQQYEEAAGMLIKILNYAVDFNLSECFLRTIKQIAQFYTLINKFNFSIFYFNQARLCAFLLNYPDLIIESLIGCSLCCRTDEFFREAMIFLKKALQYCWFHNKLEFELKIYDEMGKIYYLMGQLENAMKFHQKFINAQNEPDQSPQKTLSKQRITKYYSEKRKIFSQIDQIFLATLTLPILPFSDLQPLTNHKQSVRNELGICTKYFHDIPNLSRVLLKILASDFFNDEIEEPDSITISTATLSNFSSSFKRKKYNVYDLKLKQHLKQLGISNQTKLQLKPDDLQYKVPLDQKVKKKLNEPGLVSNWQVKMIKEIKRDRQNNLFKINSQIRVRGKNKPIRPQIDHIRKIFLPFYR